MLVISQEMQNEITKKHIIFKIVDFLKQRTPDKKLQILLKDQPRLNSILGPLWAEYANESEYFVAVVFTLALACECEGDNFHEIFFNASTDPDPEYIMQLYYSDRGYIRLCELEL